MDGFVKVVIGCKPYLVEEWEELLQTKMTLIYAHARWIKLFGAYPPLIIFSVYVLANIGQLFSIFVY